MAKWMVWMTMMTTPVFVLSQKVDVHRCISYQQSMFDSDTCCWRMLADLAFYHEAAELIKLYLDKNRNITNKHSLHWHLGQMLAKAGQTEEAIYYLKKTYNGFYSWFGGSDGRAWYNYANGTVAFLERDKNELLQMIDHWPQDSLPDKNYKMLQTLLEHWELTYKDATADPSL
jgi:hypothetical protein